MAATQSHNQTADYAHMIQPGTPQHPEDISFSSGHNPSSTTLLHPIAADKKSDFVKKSADESGYGKKASDEKKWPGHNLCQKVLGKFQSKFGHNELLPAGPPPSTDMTLEHQIKKTARDTVNDVKGVWRQARKGSDATLAAMQNKFGNHTERANDLTFEQQIRKTVSDTASDAKNTVKQAKNIAKKDTKRTTTEAWKAEDSENKGVTEMSSPVHVV
jgi:hypothetical protein